MSKKHDLESVVIRFSGDSGDGMQLTGTQFSNTSAVMGNDISTFPDYPSEIRAPQGTVAGVSGFQVHIGSSEVVTPGDDVDMLVAMNAAALRANLNSVRPGGTIIVNIDSFKEKDLSKAGYDHDPLKDTILESYQVIPAHISSQTIEALKDQDLDNKAKERCKNFYALGMTYFFYNRTLDPTIKWIEDKFKKVPVVCQANIICLKAGHAFAETTESIVANYHVPPAKIAPGTYRQINGNTATALGFVAAAKAADLPLFLGSYPITPASDILHELSRHKAYGVKTFQAEDEIAGICSAIGASLAGSLALTTSSGPGIALKAEAIGLAVMYETPLVIVNVQRGGPSTGLPTKTEQSDLMQAMYGRNGEAPLVVISASRPNDCFETAYEACRIALEHMTPVFLLSDGYIANGSEPWRLPDIEKNFSKIQTRKLDPKTADPANFKLMARNENLARNWVIPGMEGFEHRTGGLERDFNTGNVSYDPINHQKMSDLREEKIKRVANSIPEQKVLGEKTGDLLVISWGGTFGAVQMGVKELQSRGEKISLIHMRYINPMPKNIEEIIKGFKNIIIPELNNGQLRAIFNAKFNVNAKGYNKLQGQPFKISELIEVFTTALKKG